MAQITTGIRSILSNPRIYDGFSKAIGERRGRSIYINQYVRPQSGDTVLDIGCGTGSVLQYIASSIEYYGFDASNAYIERARQAYGSRGRFVCATVDRSLVERYQAFDVVMAQGILHHLDDEQSRALIAIANAALKPSGRLVTIDPCYDARQSALSRLLVSYDRGQNIRMAHEYERLACEGFADVEVSVRHDLLRIPYSHAIMVCNSPRSVGGK